MVLPAKSLSTGWLSEVCRGKRLLAFGGLVVDGFSMRALAIGMKYFMIVAVTNCRLCVWLLTDMCTHMQS